MQAGVQSVERLFGQQVVARQAPETRQARSSRDSGPRGRRGPASWGEPESLGRDSPAWGEPGGPPGSGAGRGRGSKGRKNGGGAAAGPGGGELPGEREVGGAARKVRDFMVPAVRAVTCLPGDHLGAAVRAMVDERIGCCVVVESIEGGGAALRPLGVLTKSDVCRAFLCGHSPDAALVDVMPHSASGEDVRCVGEEVECAEAAEFLEASGVRHLVVKNSVGAFVGLVTAWDITRELALDTRAWPWNRESRLFSLSGDRATVDRGVGN